MSADRPRARLFAKPGGSLPGRSAPRASPPEAFVDDAEIAELDADAVAVSELCDAPAPRERPVVAVRRTYAPAALAWMRSGPAGESAPSPRAAASEIAMASAPGKIILIGEHAVVYGHRAIAAAVDLATTVTLSRTSGPTYVEDAPFEDERLDRALATVLPKDGLAVSIVSTLPVGCGLGSSAALAVATVRALARMEGREASLGECIERGFAMERVFHGNPSGVDHTVSASGGALIYRRGAPAETLTVARPLRLVIANTGTAGSTAEMVERVRERNPTELLMRVGALVEMTAARIARGEPIGEFLCEAHRMMRLMGVSTPRLDDLVRAMESAGSTGAKLAGAGGGGIVIALVDQRAEDAVRRAAESLTPEGVFTTVIQASA